MVRRFFKYKKGLISESFCGEGGSRTLDKGLMSPLLWPLSYLAVQQVE